MSSIILRKCVSFPSQNPKISLNFTLRSRRTASQLNNNNIINFEDLRGKYLPLTEFPHNDDVKCIEQRQLESRCSGILAVDLSKCRHGKPRAFVRHPVGEVVSSGMIRLSCPHLVKAIDNWEAEGGIESINKILSKNTDLQNDFLNTNLMW